jgi:VWFA-related protein
MHIRLGRSRWLIAAGIIGGVLAAADSATQPAPPVFRVGAELVVVDLVATDRDGRFIADLQPGEITLLEDGKPQDVQFVRLVRADGSTPEPRQAGAPAPTDTHSLSELPLGETASDPSAVAMAVVIDLVTTPPQAMQLVREAIQRTLIDELPAGTSLLLATLGRDGIKIQEPFTTDRGRLSLRVAKLPGPAGGHIAFADLLDRADQACDVAVAAVGVSAAPIEQAIALGRALVLENQHMMAEASAGLATLSRSMASMPGRKHVVFYSAGYALNPINDVIDVVSAGAAACLGDTVYAGVRGRGGEELNAARALDTTAALQSAIDRANRSQVSFYAIDVRGLMATNVQAQQRGSARLTRTGGQLQKYATLDQTHTQEYLRAVATGTGGRAFLNTNDLGRGFKRAWVDGSEYYLVGYAPSGARKKGSFRKIELKVSRPGLDLRYRQGYYEASQDDLAQADLQTAMRFPAVFQSDDLGIEAAIDGRSLKVVAFLQPGSLTFMPAGSVQKCDISLHAVLRDSQGTVIGGRALFGKDITLRLDAERMAALLDSDHVEIPVVVDAPPHGTYQLTLVARHNGRIMAQTMDLTVGAGERR